MRGRGFTPAETKRLCADVPGVKRAGHGGVFAAFENRPSVGEDGHLVGRNTEADKEFVVAHVRNRGGEAGAQCSQIENPVAFMYLHGVAAAHGNVRLCFPLEIREFTAGTNTALRVAGDMK